MMNSNETSSHLISQLKTMSELMKLGITGTFTLTEKDNVPETRDGEIVKIKNKLFPEKYDLHVWLVTNVFFAREQFACFWFAINMQ